MLMSLCFQQIVVINSSKCICIPLQQTVANMIHQLWGNNLGKLYQCAQVQKEMFSGWNTSVAFNLTLSNTSLGLGCDCEGKLEYSGKTHTQGEHANPRRKTGGSWWSFLPIIAPLCCPVDSCKLCYVSFTCLEPAWFKCNIIFVFLLWFICIFCLFVCLGVFGCGRGLILILYFVTFFKSISHCQIWDWKFHLDAKINVTAKNLKSWCFCTTRYLKWSVLLSLATASFNKQRNVIFYKKSIQIHLYYNHHFKCTHFIELHYTSVNCLSANWIFCWFISNIIERKKICKWDTFITVVFSIILATSIVS